MGMVIVSVRGSFGSKPDQSFYAQDGGHAMALSRAIEYLSQQIPEAVRLDHTLAAEGASPDAGFGRLREKV